MSGGLLQSVRTLLASLLGLASTRLELFSTELEEALTRLAAALLGALTVLLLAAMAFAFAALALVMALGEEHRLLAVMSIAGGFLLLAAVGAWGIRRCAGARPRLFDSSLAELRRDQDALSSGHGTQA